MAERVIEQTTQKSINAKVSSRTTITVTTTTKNVAKTTTLTSQQVGTKTFKAGLSFQ